MSPHRSARTPLFPPWLASVALLVAGAAIAAPPASEKGVRIMMGPQFQFLRPDVEGFPTLFAVGPEAAASWQFEHLQLRAQLHLLGAGGLLSLKEGETTSSFRAWGFGADLGGRVAVGGFAENSLGYLYAYPAFFSLHAWIEDPEGQRQAHLNELAVQLGAGHVFHLSPAPNADASVTLFHLHVSPQTSHTTLTFTPGLSVAFALW